MRYLITLFAMLTVSGKVDGQEFGSVRGVVLDAGKNPVSGAIVYGLPERDMRHKIQTTSDSTGVFLMTNVPPGAIYLDAYNESLGYPYNAFSFFGVSKGPVKISVSAGRVFPDVVIQLGPKGARLNLEIMNIDGAPVTAGAGLVFTRDDVPRQGRYERGARAKESILVPAVPFRLAVKAAGYQEWHYGGESWQGNEGLIVLTSGGVLNLLVRLKPE